MQYSVEEVSFETHGEELFSIRYPVFVVEQDVPEELERDAMDPLCTHFLATDESGEAIGTARVDREGHIGRVAVLESWRGRGVGTLLMEAAVQCCVKMGLAEALLNSQTSALEFYLKLGFETRGEEFMEAGIPHVTMFKSLAE